MVIKTYLFWEQPLTIKTKWKPVSIPTHLTARDVYDYQFTIHNIIFLLTKSDLLIMTQINVSNCIYGVNF